MPVSYNPFRELPEDIPAYEPEVNSKLRITCCSKNSQLSNLPVLMQSVGRFLRYHDNASAYFHVNVDDEGEYDLEYLKDRYDPDRRIVFPKEFVSFYEGIPHDQLMNRFFNSDVFIDCSMASAVSLSCFEAMSVGCIPMLPNRGSAGDLLKQIREAIRFALKDVDFLGEREGFLFITSQKDVYEQLERVYSMQQKDPFAFLSAKQDCANLCKGLAVK